MIAKINVNFRKKSGSSFERPTKATKTMGGAIKIARYTRNAIGVEQRGKAPLRTVLTLKLSERRARARADYIKWLVKRSA